MLTSIIAFIIVIAICVVVHEYGHYITARLLGVQVHEFAFGMGPVVRQHASTRGGARMLWSWRVLPVGGFCRLAGMGEDAEDEVVLPGMGFNEQPAWKRFFILLNGSLFNIILALFLTVFFLCGHGVLDMNSTRIGEIMAGFPAEQAGLQVGDRVTAVSGKPVEHWREMSDALRTEGGKGAPVRLDVLRGERSLTVEIVIPMNGEYGRPMLGVSPSMARYGLLEAARSSVGYTWQMTKLMLRGIADWVLRRQEVDVTGPVGIASMSGRAMREGFWSFLSFLAMISLNLGLLNLFPIPALDGGRILFVLLEMLLRRRLPERVENWIHAAGFAVLISLMIFITCQDVYHLFWTK
ncbi:MAG: site-2 protease family protein [Fretibacterium sp.]|nr:site-2 protease family protein [Fretibacterium sp.]